MTLQEKKRSDSPSPSGKLPVTIEELVVWTYKVQRAEDMTGGTAMGPAGVISQLGAIGSLGTRVAGGGAGLGALHDDALAVHEAVMALPRRVSELLRLHGRFATRPDPRIGARHRLEPHWDLEPWPGHPDEYLRLPVMEWVKLQYYTGWIVPVYEVDRPELVERDRKAWIDWRGGLERIGFQVADRLVKHTLTGVIAESGEPELDLPPLVPWAS